MFYWVIVFQGCGLTLWVGHLILGIEIAKVTDSIKSWFRNFEDYGGFCQFETSVDLEFTFTYNEIQNFFELAVVKLAIRIFYPWKIKSCSNILLFQCFFFTWTLRNAIRIRWTHLNSSILISRNTISHLAALKVKSSVCACTVPKWFICMKCTQILFYLGV